MHILALKIKYLKENKKFLIKCNDLDLISSEFEFNFFASNIIRIYEEVKFLKEKHFVIEDNVSIVDNKYDNMFLRAFFLNNIIIVNCNYGKFEFEIEEVDQVYDYYCECINYCYKLSFDIRKIDPIYLSIFLWKRINKIKYICIDYTYLDDLYVPLGKSDKRRLEETDVYKTFLYGKKYCIDSVFNSNHVNESSYDRTLKIFNSIKNYGYPYRKQYIILYNNEDLIRDGQHRACSLKYIYGNIKVPVMRIFLSDR